MRRLNRPIAALLLLCMVLTMLPALPFASAAEVAYRYELDTDGIDAGADYLIVNTGVATGENGANALRFNYQSYWNRDLRNQTLTVKTDDAGIAYIDVGFTNEADCQFRFSATSAGRITHGNYALNLDGSAFVSGDPDDTLTFTNAGGGAYRIHYTSWWRTYYLRYSNSDWARSDESSTVYLFKLTEYVVGYDVTYNGNGYTAGTLPADATELDPGAVHTVQAPSADLRMDVDEDTWLFQCWNTAPDGSGTEYAPGETVTVDGDITLYVQWYQQIKHTVSMITYLDDVATDVTEISGQDKSFFVLLEGGDGTYIPLKHTAAGTYSAKVPDNGTYVVYAQTDGGAYEAVHGHKIMIYNQDGSTECLHYSVTYDANGGAWAEGQAPGETRHHALEAVTACTQTPTLEGNRFLGWKDQQGNWVQPGQQITSAISEKTVLTAQWERTISVTVNVTVDHNAASGGADNDSTMHNVVYTLLREENGVNLPLEEKTLTTGYTYDAQQNTTTYQIVYTDMPQGIYNASSVKTSYEGTITREGEADENQTINIHLAYAPKNSDLTFRVEVRQEDLALTQLHPESVNVKVSYWGYNEEDVLGWHIITQQEGSSAPTNIKLENGVGEASFPVWRLWSGTNNAYEYRMEVTSFVLPDGTIVAANGGDHISYTASGTALYTATVAVKGGRVPVYPDGSTTQLPGAYFDGTVQLGQIVATVDIHPMTVTFDAGDGLVQEQTQIVLTEQYRYPDLSEYIGVPNDRDKLFVCWMEGEAVAENKAGQLMTGDVTYTARYNENITISGDVTVAATYEVEGGTATSPDTDRATRVMVVLQKQVGSVFNDVASMEVAVTYTRNADGSYTTDPGTGSYAFADIPNDGTVYRIQTLILNYTGAYDNNNDGAYATEEAVAIVDDVQAAAQVDIHLALTPECYQQAVRVDVEQINKDLRPTDVLVQYLYRDLGDVHHYDVISQHLVGQQGTKVEIDGANAEGLGFEDVWNWHTNATLYEYQARVSAVYGNNVEGAYSEEGTPYTDASPFTVEYGPSNNYLQQTAQGGVMLEATLIPKEYPVKLDLNLGDDADTPVYGLENYMVDDGTGDDRYVYLHTWSYEDRFEAFPYREGYVFRGWTVAQEDEDDVHIETDTGTIHVGATLARSITLTAQWDELSGTDYSIRYLELNTDQVLHGATMVSGVAEGTVITAAEAAIAIEGFAYAGALVAEGYVDKTENPFLTVSSDPTKNLMVIYYLPDGSDGYTEQVESNLEIGKDAVLEDNGTYTISLETYTKDNPITTLIQQNTPLDIVLVLDQSGSLAANDFEYLNALQEAVDSFVESVADHGRRNEVDHRVALVGYAGNASDGHSSDPVKATGGKQTDSWINTGVFDSNGEFHLYNVNGFNYTLLADNTTITADGIYYTRVTVDGQDKYLLLTHHNEYRHLITEEEARLATLQGEAVFGYVYNEQGVGSFVELTRNSSGLWLYGDKRLYSDEEFFTYHTDVWTHRDGIQPRQIHAYGVGTAYTPADGHNEVYTREETTGTTFQQSIYQDALIPVSVGAAGSGGTNPGLLRATQSLGADGATRASYGMELANEILKATPVDESEGRVRLVVMFTDGEPGYMGFDSSSGDSYYQQAVTEANNAISQSYITKNTYGAYVYTIGLYESAGVESTSEVAYYMNALSSNYPNAKSMDDIKASVTYVQAEDGTVLEDNGRYYVNYNGSYYEIAYGYVRVSGSYYSRYCWYYKRGSTNYSISTATYPTVSGGKVGSYTIYERSGGYAATEHSGYYATTESADQLQSYFENVLQDITTKITTEIILHSDTILRDIMGQGLVLTPGTEVIAYRIPGSLDLDTDEVIWKESGREEVARVTIPENMPGQITSQQTTTITYISDDGTQGTKTVPYISIYNLDSANPTDPDAENYLPHTVDVTGYDFDQWYINEGHDGYKMEVTISRVEATDDVQWGRSTETNHEQSGLWLPADEQENRELLLPFDQPTTIFVERAYVLDYGKEFTLAGWYFDDGDEASQEATPVHVDNHIASGMNYFATPQTEAPIRYGEVTITDVQTDEGEAVVYSPNSMSWGGYDQFYVFGDTWRKTVLAQDANQNGNLWNKVTVIPANNIYYEDSFVTSEQTGIEGFTFTGAWEVVGTPGNNTELPETVEGTQYGGVHGWTDDLADDKTYTDGTAHITGQNGEMGASVEFTFTGTGVDIYTRTNNKSGMVGAILYSHASGAKQHYQTLFVDNLAASGDYYQVPTVSFNPLPYGTYTVELIATGVSTATGTARYEYALDGVRVYNPLGNTTNYAGGLVQGAYGLETNAVFTEVRDILLDYQDFNGSIGNEGAMGAVFIDWIQEDQGAEGDTVGTATPTYVIDTYETFGPKNEVYLGAGQAIALRVDEANYYAVGLKSLSGKPVSVNVSGIDRAEPTTVSVAHTAELYYRVTPVDGYIVIQNANTDGSVLSVTKLRTTSLSEPAPDGGVLPLEQTQTLMLMNSFSAYLLSRPEEETQPEQTPEQTVIASPEATAKNNDQLASVLFGNVRKWLETT